MSITIDALPPTAAAQSDDFVVVMRDGETIRVSVGQLLALLVGVAPDTLDTLNELAAALGNDPNYAATTASLIASKLNASAASSFGLTLIAALSASVARTTLGLGTAATANIGMSGGTVPLLNVGNTFSAQQIISVVAGTALALSAGSNALQVRVTGNETSINFRNAADSGSRGSIFHSNDTSTTYATSSDHRQKIPDGEVEHFWTRINATKPRSFQWIGGGHANGFFAHEFQEVYPEAVSGHKDEIEDIGTAVMGGLTFAGVSEREVPDGAEWTKSGTRPVYQTMQASTPDVMADIFAALKDIHKRLEAAGL